MNPMQRMMQISQLMKGMKNPQQAMLQMLSNNNTPMAQNVLKMVQNGDIQGVEQFARNISKEKGINYDETINMIRNMFGM